MQSILARMSARSTPVTAAVPEIVVPGHSCPKPADSVPPRPHHNAVAMGARIVAPDQSKPNHKAEEAAFRGIPS